MEGVSSRSRRSCPPVLAGLTARHGMWNGASDAGTMPVRRTFGAWTFGDNAHPAPSAALPSCSTGDVVRGGGSGDHRVAQHRLPRGGLAGRLHARPSPLPVV